jgi:hypothetical protein
MITVFTQFHCLDAFFFDPLKENFNKNFDHQFLLFLLSPFYQFQSP